MTNRAIEKDGVLYFKCKKCGEEKPLNSAYFHRNTTAMMGYNSKCIECVREEMKTIYKPKERYITKAELVEENRKLKEEVKELGETLYHRDSVLSIMYDLLRSDLSDYEQLCMIDVVIDVEVGNEPQNKLREELLDRFWKRDF